MLRKLLKNKKAQNTAEYAILISLVVAGIIAMQTYAQRALQGKVRDAAQYMTTRTTELGNTVQYEPYYLSTDYNVLRDDDLTQVLDNQTTAQYDTQTRKRMKDGFQESTYNATKYKGLVNGL